MFFVNDNGSDNDNDNSNNKIVSSSDSIEGLPQVLTSRSSAAAISPGNHGDTCTCMWVLLYPPLKAFLNQKPGGCIH